MCWKVQFSEIMNRISTNPLYLVSTEVIHTNITNNLLANIIDSLLTSADSKIKDNADTSISAVNPQLTYMVIDYTNILQQLL